MHKVCMFSRSFEPPSSSGITWSASSARPVLSTIPQATHRKPSRRRVLDRRFVRSVLEPLRAVLGRLSGSLWSSHLDFREGRPHSTQGLRNGRIDLNRVTRAHGNRRPRCRRRRRMDNQRSRLATERTRASPRLTTVARQTKNPQLRHRIYQEDSRKVRGGWEYLRNYLGGLPPSSSTGSSPRVTSHQAAKNTSPHRLADMAIHN